jgi:hypothetical protein
MEMNIVNKLTIDSGYLRRLIVNMRATSLRDDDRPCANARGRDHMVRQGKAVGLDAPREEPVAEIDVMTPEHQCELVALMWVGRGDFGEEEWDEALALAAERTDLPTSRYLLSHMMAADDIASGLTELGHAHILRNGMCQNSGANPMC